MMFRILLGIDGVVGAVLLVSFISGLASGGMPLFTGALWIVILGGIAAIIGSSVRLNNRGNTLMARLLLMILAGPGLGGGMFALTLLLLRPSMN